VQPGSGHAVRLHTCAVCLQEQICGAKLVFRDVLLAARGQQSLTYYMTLEAREEYYAVKTKTDVDMRQTWLDFGNVKAGWSL